MRFQHIAQMLFSYTLLYDALVSLRVPHEYERLPPIVSQLDPDRLRDPQHDPTICRSGMLVYAACMRVYVRLGTTNLNSRLGG